LPLLALLLLSNRKGKLKFSDGDRVMGQPKPHFATFASALLAGKITYIFAKLNDKLRLALSVISYFLFFMLKYQAVGHTKIFEHGCSKNLAGLRALPCRIGDFSSCRLIKKMKTPL
jgi:hypothetical protein